MFRNPLLYVLAVFVSVGLLLGLATMGPDTDVQGDTETLILTVTPD